MYIIIDKVIALFLFLCRANKIAKICCSADNGTTNTNNLLLLNRRVARVQTLECSSAVEHRPTHHG
jgi:hypothetical protein